MVARCTVIFVCVWAQILSSVSVDPLQDFLTGNASGLPFSIDFANPINIPVGKIPNTKVEPSRPASLREVRNAPIVLFDGDRDRLEQISLMREDGGGRNTIDGRMEEEGIGRMPLMKFRINDKMKSKRERDRFLHSESSIGSLNFNRFPSSSNPKVSNAANDLQKKIKLDREDEIRREVKKSIDLREKILRGKEMQKFSDKRDWSGRDRKLHSIIVETTPFNSRANSIDKNQRERDRDAHSRDGTIQEANISGQRERDRAIHEKDRVTYGQRRSRLPLLKRDDSSARRQDQLSKRLGDPETSLERREKERRDRISLAVRNNPNGRYEERPRTNDYYNNMRPNYGIGVQKHNTEPYQNYAKIKPPILIVEKIPIPVAAIPSTEESAIVRPQISILYDERGAGKPDEGFYMDRRPERPGTSLHDNSEESIHIEEVLILQAPHPIHFAQSPLHYENIRAPILLPVNPNDAAEIAIANHVAQAAEVEKLNQAATLSEIARLNRIKLSHAINEHLHAEGLAAYVANKQAQILDAHAAQAQAQIIAEHVANNQAQAFATHAHTKAAIEQDASNQVISTHAINAAQAHAANSHLEAAIENTAATHALREQAVIKDAVKNTLVLKKRLADTHSEIVAATEDDLVNLAIKNGIKDALRTQITNHLKDKIITSDFFHHMQPIKEELLQRLELLRPYFQSGSGEYLVPEEIPLLSYGTAMHSDELQNLPKVHVTPASLITPGFIFPKDMILDANNNLDIRYVEYLLRLPEPQFSKVMQIPKGEFLLALFPPLYDEIFDDSSYNRDIGFPQPNESAINGLDGLTKNIQHNHYHIHHDSPASTSSQHFQKIQPDSKVTFAENHFRQHDGSKFLSFTPSPEFSNPISEYRESSYVSYDPKLSGRQDETNYSSLYTGKVDATTPKPYTALTIKHFLTTAAPSVTPAINGIQVRPKGYGTHHYLTTPISKEMNIQRDFWTTRIPSVTSPDTYDLSVLLDSDQGTKEVHGSPLHKHSIVKTISHSITEDYTSIPSFPIKTLANSANYIIRLPQPNKKKQELTSVAPFIQQPPLNNHIPHLATPLSAIEASIPYPLPMIPLSFPQTTPLPHSGETLKQTPLNKWPLFTTIFTKYPEDESSEIEQISTIASPESTLFNSVTESPLASAPVVPQENRFGLIPFRGFSGNVRQKTNFEKLAEQVDRENELMRQPGTDENDDNHVVSIFRKKKGNATDFTTQIEKLKFNLSEKQTKNSEELSEEERRRLGVVNFRGEFPRTSNELIIDKIKEITGTTTTRPQETPTIVKFAGVNSRPIENLFFPDSRNNFSDSSSDNNTIHPSQDPLPTSTEEIRSSKKYNTRLLDFGDRPEMSGDSFLKGSWQNRTQSASSKKIPLPRRVESTPASFADLNRTPNLDSLTFRADAVGVTAEPYSLTTKNIIRKQPSYLKAEPPCSVTGTLRRAFCLYPEGYPQNEAEKLIAKYKNVIEDGIELLKSLPERKVNLNAARKQLPHLNLTVTCETETKSVQLSWSRDTLGNWFTVLQPGSFQQIVNITTCGSSARIKGCQPLLQLRPLIVFHPEIQNARPQTLEFPLPVGCVFVSQK